MSLFADNSRTFRRGLPAFFLVTALGLSGCGGGDGGSSEAGGGAAPDQEEVAEVAETDDAAEAEGPDAADVPDAVALLPFETDVPSDSRMLPASCEPGGSDDPDRPKGTGDDAVTSAEEETKYSTWITYAVPRAWDTVGRGSGGSGGVTGTNEDLTFRFDDGGATKGDIKVSVDWDSRKPDGTITDTNGEPWESFDYESTIGDDSETITYDKVATVQVGDQEADLFHLDPTQAPDHVSATEYKVRLDAFKIPGQSVSGDFALRTASFVATIEFDEEDTPLDQTTVESIVGSFVLPECSYDHELEQAELTLNLDLNGDGHIRSAEDVQKEMQEMQDELEAQLEEERQG